MSKNKELEFGTDEMLSDGSNGLPMSPDVPNGTPMTTPVISETARPFVPHPGTKNLSMNFGKSNGSRMEYDDVQTGEHVFIDYVECGAFIVCVVARDKKRIRAMRNNIEDALEEVSEFDFFARRGWNIVQVSSGRSSDNEIGLPIITIVQSGL